MHCILGEAEPREFAVLRYLIRDGCLAIDAGANRGVYTKYLSRYGPRSKVLSIEPIPTTFKLLQSNIHALRLPNVRAMQYALSDISKTVVMEIPEAANGLPNYYLARVKYSGANEPPLRSHFTVEARTLDELVAIDGHRVCLIKSDVEMHELEMLRGATAVLRRDHPAIYAEIQPDFATKRSQHQEIVDLLTSEGYSPFWYSGSQLARWTPGTNAIDLFFLTDNHVRELMQNGVKMA